MRGHMVIQATSEGCLRQYFLQTNINSSEKEVTENILHGDILLLFKTSDQLQ
jgi:hypothetical protein